ncbi:MAG: thioredoxin family protein, partial [Sphingomonas bacterium]|nr:thioredoxin family protein [Sphingomonas bacterium]
VPGPVPSADGPGLNALLLAILGALAGGILLNLMPCVFPILALKALHLARSGGNEATARRDALGYAAGAIVGTGALGIALLAIRAGGSAAGWAFQLQDPRTILLLALLATAISLNLLRVFELPVIGSERNPTGSFGTGALAAFVATPCAGPFLGAALGTALLLPAAGSIAVFAALGLGLALPFVVVAFVPALRSKLPRPGPWMVRLQRILAVPMALTAIACLWLLWRQGGGVALGIGLAGALGLGLLLFGLGVRQRDGQSVLWGVPVALALIGGTIWLLPPRSAETQRAATGREWSEAAVAREQAAGRPVFAYFTADWCLTCKVNEAGAIDRNSVQAAFRKARVTTLVGDWTNGDPAITRLLESRGRAGVPLYLWYEPGKPEPEELPQVLTPSMLSERAARSR